MKKQSEIKINLKKITKTITQNEYSDGEIENKLLAHFSQDEPDNIEFVEKNPGWATTYHLSKVRENLLNWIDFKKNSSVLEVGAGCGALTGVISKKVKSVTALELSERRATINAQRHRLKKNVEVVVGNLEDLKSSQLNKYDYVVCIGVLEYAGRFISRDKPFESFLKDLVSNLKNDGILILAIENKLGLKYWTGAKEDHTLRYLEGIEGYPHYDGIRTFGKKELTDLIVKTGLEHYQYFYPYPDYKLPQVIFSDNFMPGNGTSEKFSSYFPTPTPDQTRQQIAREQLVVRTIAQNNLYDNFSNSFLVLASKEKFVQNTVFARGSTSRNEKYQVLTKILHDSSNLKVTKQALSNAGIKHIEKIHKNHISLSKAISNFTVVNSELKDSSLSFPYIYGTTLQEELVDALTNNNQELFENLLKRFIFLTDSLPISKSSKKQDDAYLKIFKSQPPENTRVHPGVIDINFDNIIIEKKMHLIDCEWVLECGVPKDFIVWRAFIYFFYRHSQVVRAIASPTTPIVQLAENLYVPRFIYIKYKNIWKNNSEFNILEDNFQKYIANLGSSLIFFKDPIFIDTELADNTLDELENLRNRLNSSIEKQENTQKELIEAISELERIKSSKIWKVAKRLKRLLS